MRTSTATRAPSTPTSSCVPSRVSTSSSRRRSTRSTRAVTRRSPSTPVRWPPCSRARTRPTHFHGVLTVVAKLFGLVRPDVAVFGEKDYQQLVLIRRMVADLCMGVDVVGAEIVREHDGLALSSRNRYLDEDHRWRATALSRTLFAARRAAKYGARRGPRRGPARAPPRPRRRPRLPRADRPRSRPRPRVRTRPAPDRRPRGQHPTDRQRRAHPERPVLNGDNRCCAP